MKEKIESFENVKYVGSDTYSDYYDVFESNGVRIARLKLTGSEISVTFNDFSKVSHIDEVITAIIKGGE